MLEKIKSFTERALEPIKDRIESIKIENGMVIVTITTDRETTLTFRVAHKPGQDEMFACALFEHVDGKEKCLSQHFHNNWHGMADRIKLSHGWIDYCIHNR